MNKKFIYCAIICNGWSRVEKNVIADDLNKALEVVNNSRFRRDSGWQCGSDRWNVTRISVPTEKEILDIKEENLRKILIHTISSFDFERLSTNELKQVYNIVKGKE